MRGWDQRGLSRHQGHRENGPGPAGEAARWSHCCCSGGRLATCFGRSLTLPAFSQLPASRQQLGVVAPSEGRARWFTELFVRDSLQTLMRSLLTTLGIWPQRGDTVYKSSFRGCREAPDIPQKCRIVCVSFASGWKGHCRLWTSEQLTSKHRQRCWTALLINVTV